MTSGVSSQATMIVAASAVAEFAVLAQQQPPWGLLFFPGDGAQASSFWRHLTIPWGGQLNCRPLQGAGINQEEPNMAKFNNDHYCKLTFTENQNPPVVRRIQHFIVQSPDGRVQTLEGRQLPVAIALYSGRPKAGTSLTVLLGTPPAKSFSEFAAEFLNGTRARDLGFMFVGMLVNTGLQAVYDMLRQALKL